MTQVRGKVVAVTGAGSGIGRALAVQLSEAGAKLALSDVDDVGLRETAAMLRGSFTTHVVDVRDQAAVKRYAAEVESRHGGCDVIINNAGLAVRSSIADITYEQFRLVMDVNFYGVVHGSKEFLPLLSRRPVGHIVNIASINAMVPFAKNGPYNASKYAVLGFSETLMQELSGSNVRVTCVHPGGIRTNIARAEHGFSKKESEFFDRIAITSAAQAAATIIEGIESDRQRVYVGLDSKLMAAAKRVVPDWTVRLIGAASSDLSKSRTVERLSSLARR
ncbi:MAG: acetoin dehydrogenase [Myxococcaceae bacterium]|nr:acetoin dehydrogenase [Myxococcaceae bacterium]